MVQVVLGPREGLLEGLSVTHPDRPEHRVGLPFRGRDVPSLVVYHAAVRLDEASDVGLPGLREHRSARSTRDPEDQCAAHPRKDPQALSRPASRPRQKAARETGSGHSKASPKRRLPRVATILAVSVNSPNETGKLPSGTSMGPESSTTAPSVLAV